MRIIGLIPARGGSKGISRKNLRNLNGIPLVGHKIIQAQKSACTEVWVSSEDDEIRNTSINRIKIIS
jgi:CMP-N-acetylneuraminic acid synthetase